MGSRRTREDRDNITTHVATIITHDHIDHVLTLRESMEAHRSVVFHVLIVNPHRDKLDKLSTFQIKIYTVEDLSSDPHVGSLVRLMIPKYLNLSPKMLPSNIHHMDYMRWALKPAFLSYVLQQYKLDFVLHCDCDLHFYNDFGFILEQFNTNKIILSPHWRPIKPIINNEYRWNFLHGLYNAGFIGIRHDALDMLEWWAEMCVIECNANTANGTFVDQKYLDVVPLYFDGVYILLHKGCNVAAWNLYQLPRNIDENGDLIIAGDQLIFAHFSGVSVDYVTKGIDIKLYGPYLEYQESLKRKRIELIRKGMTECMPKTESNIVII